MFLATDPILMDLQKASKNKRKREDGIQPLISSKRDKKQTVEPSVSTAQG
jgi:hypothetical protein